MPAGVVVNGRFESSNIDGFSHSSGEPVMVAIDDLKILFSEVMAFFSCVLENS